MFTRNSILTRLDILGSNPASYTFLSYLYRAKKRKKYTSVLICFRGLKARIGLRSPISLCIARISPKMQKETSFVVVDKRGFFDGGRYRTRTYDLPHVKRML